jgi:hypothetical protein
LSRDNDNNFRAITIRCGWCIRGDEEGRSTFVDHTTASAEVARELDAAAKKSGLNSSTQPAGEALISRFYTTDMQVAYQGYLLWVTAKE